MNTIYQKSQISQHPGWIPCVFWEMSVYGSTVVSKHLLITYHVQGIVLDPEGKMKHKTVSKNLCKQKNWT